MLEWLVLLAGMLLVIMNQASREHASTLTTPSDDSTITLPPDLLALLETYKTNLATSRASGDTASGQAASSAKLQIDAMLAQWTQDIPALQEQVKVMIDADKGLAPDVNALHEKVSKYETALPTLNDNLTKAIALTSEKAEDTATRTVKAVAIFVLGVFGVFVRGVF